MKPKLLATAACLAALLGNSAQAEHFQQPHITVYGTATTEVVPNLMRWRLYLRTNGKTASQAANAHDQNVSAVIAFLRQQKIAEKKIQTSQLQLAEDWEYIGGGQRVQKGYYAATVLSFESPSLENYPSLWKGISQLPSVSIEGVMFDISNRIQIQENTRIQALLAAKKKAERLASALETRIGQPLLIEEESSRRDDIRTPIAFTAQSSAAETEKQSLSPGTLSIQARIKAVFHLLHD